MESNLIEKQIIKKILEGKYQNILPSERELAKEFNVTRQKIREVLQRLQRDGWIEIQHGMPTKIRFIFEEGGLSILNSLIHHNLLKLPNITREDFIVKLLEIRYALAPVYTEACLKENPQVVLDYLSKGLELDSINRLFSNPKEITNFDWNMHRILCKHSNNIIFLFLLNSFKEIYFYFGVKYFSLEEARERSIKFYNNFYKYILKSQKEKAIQEMKNVTKDSIEILKKALTKNKEKL
jgi:GntR family negative regulator for fad regulon and positive regulator of fabA